MNNHTGPADALLARVLLEILQGRASVRGEVELEGSSLEQDQHFESCPYTTISNVAGEDGHCGNGTCNLGRIWMTVNCPHQESARGFYGQLGSLVGMLADMKRVARGLGDDVLAEQFGAHAAESLEIANETFNAVVQSWPTK